MLNALDAAEGHVTRWAGTKYGAPQMADNGLELYLTTE